ncbi:DoxX family protein [Marinomonas rhizomae]|uniref:DoxX family protein n=1 Tax=Marinomonas rhizomae TaxID=491948 RepID=UPI0021081E3B|nr:DoxX family protein [Marinomonas rhizomae]UTV99293.1 DoxX family protein [Marinomonas rhizomae]
MKLFSYQFFMTWLLVAFFVFAGLLNVFPPAPLLEDYSRWGYPDGFHYITAALELLSAYWQTKSSLKLRQAGLALGGLVLVGALITLVLYQQWLHVIFPLLVLVVLLFQFRQKPLRCAL